MRAKLARALFIALLLPVTALAAEIIIVSGDPPGVGFNDPTPAAPIGGNPGTTVGEQARNVFQAAAEQWGARLQSKQPILVISFFVPLTPCTPTSGVLGAAGAEWYFSDIPPAKGGKALAAGTWYPAALAEKITRQDIVADPDDPFEIFSVFNSNLGIGTCLTGNGWYYGLDHNEPANRIDLLAVVLHEFGHGLGFSVGPTNSSTGVRAGTPPLPSIWESFMLDMSTQKRWLDMTNAERAASARNNWNLVWAGQHGSNVVPSVLDFRTEVRAVNPALGVNEAQSAQFGSSLQNGVASLVVAPNDGGGTQLGCTPFPANSGAAGKIVLMNRGTCTFTTKVFNAQAAGAVAAIVANNVPEGFPTMAGVDTRIVIPSVGITQALGTALRGGLPNTYVELQRNPKIRAGTNANYPRLYAPSAFAQGSSVSHWDVTGTPNLLMEPFINTDLTGSVKNPDDLTWNLFNDLGW